MKYYLHLTIQWYVWTSSARSEKYDRYSFCTTRGYCFVVLRWVSGLDMMIEEPYDSFQV